jgi:hypothetical protein
LAKAYGAWYDDGSVFVWTEVLAELGLSCWLGSAVYVRIAWRVALAIFAAFTCITLYKVHTQSPSCGCFGPASVPPALMFSVDLAIVALLVAVQPHSVGQARRLGGRGVHAAGVLLAGILALGIAQHGAQSVTSPRNGNSMTADLTMRNRPTDFVAKAVSPTRWVADLGTVSRGKALNVLFHISSPSNRQLQIRGVNTGCGCTSIPILPKAIAAMGATDVYVVFKTPDHAANFDSKVLLTTDNPQLPPLTLSIKGNDP